MSLPGFTAETSLYRTSRHYHMAGAPTQASGAVHPAWCSPIRGWRQEEQFIDCIIRCRGNGGTVNGCRITCCQEVTGNSCCYIM